MLGREFQNAFRLRGWDLFLDKLAGRNVAKLKRDERARLKLRQKKKSQFPSELRETLKGA